MRHIRIWNTELYACEETEVSGDHLVVEAFSEKDTCPECLAILHDVNRKEFELYSQPSLLLDTPKYDYFEEPAPSAIVGLMFGFMIATFFWLFILFFVWKAYL